MTAERFIASRAVMDRPWLHQAARLVLSLVWSPALLHLRSRVRRRLGRADWVRLSRVAVVPYPNRLRLTSFVFSEGYALGKVFKVLPVSLEWFDPWHSQRNRVYLAWEDVTRTDTSPLVRLEAALREPGRAGTFAHAITINGRCTDISKRRVAEAFEEVFGYPLRVDPLSYSGKTVVKSDQNAAHDGQVIDCPIEEPDLQPGKVYNLLVGNVDADGFATDHRVIIAGGVLAVLSEKKRREERRFQVENDSVQLRWTADVLVASEIRAIDQFCARIGLEYGELDCLRDSDSGRLYIVDVAKTPAGPPTVLPRRQKLILLEELSVAFAKRCLLGRSP